MRGSRACRSRRSGFTLVELLAVIAIIGVLAALLTPALARAWARSQLTQCTNNQYQIGFALLRYDEKQGVLPGWLNDSPNDTTRGCSWALRLLPYLGRSDVYDAWPTLPNNPTIDGFVCPSSRPERPLTYPVLHYAGNVGATGTVAADGVFLNLYKGAATGVSLDTIADADGTTTTLAFAEKAARGFQPHSWVYATTTAPATLFGSGPAVPPVFGVATPPGPVAPVLNAVATRSFAPSSNHADGVVVVFCDGHTGFLANTLQPYEYAQLLTPRSRWQGTANRTNSATMQPWLLKSGKPYLLDERILRP